MQYNRQKPVKTNRFLRPLPLAVTGILVLVIGISILELTNTTHLFHAKPVPKTAIITVTSHSSTDKSESGKASDKTDTPTQPTQTPPVASSGDKGNSDTTDQTTTPTGAAPANPSGTFISNHNPSLDGDPYPSAIQSICNTTPGAKCSMTFANGGLTRTLPEQTTNSDGNAFWTWDVKQASFTEGTWTVTVTATLNGQTRTAQDSIKVGS